MICADCRAAADSVSRYGRAVANAAAALHFECTGCDCQHNVESQLNGDAYDCTEA